eukprot:Colp12_sorted_trinity150504_noHs@22425
MSSTGGDYNPNPVREVETKEEVKQEKYENYDNQWSQQQLPKESYSNGAGDETVKSQAPPGEQLSQENGTSTQQTDNKQTAQQDQSWQRPQSEQQNTAAKETNSESASDGRLHVSNIPFRFREPDLHALFAPYGEIVHTEIIYNERGSKGFGFVSLARGEDADKARKDLHGHVIDGRKIEVNKAISRGGTSTRKPFRPHVHAPPSGYGPASYHQGPAYGGYGGGGYGGYYGYGPQQDPYRQQYGGQYGYGPQQQYGGYGAAGSHVPTPPAYADQRRTSATASVDYGQYSGSYTSGQTGYGPGSYSSQAYSYDSKSSGTSHGPTRGSSHSYGSRYAPY